MCIVCGSLVKSGQQDCPGGHKKRIDRTALDRLANPDDPLIGAVICDRRYWVLRKLGSGGYGAVYLAVQLFMERPVALKVFNRPTHKLSLHLATVWGSLGSINTTDAVSGASVPPNEFVVQFFDSGELPDGRPYIATEYLHGKDLDQIVAERGPIDGRTCALITWQACLGLAAIHDAGLVHRDVKLSNLQIYDPTRRSKKVDLASPRLKIIDLGIACLEGATNYDEGGTPEYRAPEQFFKFARIDRRADVFGIGMSMFAMLTNRFPFNCYDQPGGWPEDDWRNVSTMYARSTEEPGLLREIVPDANISDELSGIIARCIARNPAARWQNMNELAGAIRNTPEYHAQRRSGPRPIDITQALRRLDSEIKIESFAMKIMRSNERGVVILRPLDSPGAAISLEPNRYMSTTSRSFIFQVSQGGTVSLRGWQVPDHVATEFTLREQMGTESCKMRIDPGAEVYGAIEFKTPYGPIQASGAYRGRVFVLTNIDRDTSDIIFLG